MFCAVYHLPMFCAVYHLPMFCAVYHLSMFCAVYHLPMFCAVYHLPVFCTSATGELGNNNGCGFFARKVWTPLSCIYVQTVCMLLMINFQLCLRNLTYVIICSSGNYEKYELEIFLNIKLLICSV